MIGICFFALYLGYFALGKLLDHRETMKVLENKGRAIAALKKAACTYPPPEEDDQRRLAQELLEAYNEAGEGLRNA